METIIELINIIIVILTIFGVMQYYSTKNNATKKNIKVESLMEGYYEHN